MPHPFAVIIPAAGGIGLELARIAARQGHDMLLADADPAIQDVVGELQYESVYVEAIEGDLSTVEGVDRVIAAADGKDIDLLCLDIGAGLGGAFLDRDMDAWRHAFDTGLVGALHLMQHVVSDMVRRGEGRVLVVGLPPEGAGAGYSAAAAFFDTLLHALRAEIAQAPGVVLTALIHTSPPNAAVLPLREAGLARQAWDTVMAGERSIEIEV